MPVMSIRVAFLAAECEPWAKTGGLADVVDALARALGRLRAGAISTPVDVFLPRYRGVPDPATVEATRIHEVPDPRSPSGHSPVTVIDVPADGYRLRLVDFPAAFDREGFYGDGDGDYADNAWRFGLFCRAALEALRADERPVDVLHLHDWHTGPAAIFRGARYADDPIIGRAAILMTLHNLAYHGWTPRTGLPQLGLAPGDGIVPPNADGIDLLRSGIERAELVNTVSPGFAVEALTPAFGMGLDATLRQLGDRFIGILNGLDTKVWDPSNDADLAAPYSRANPAGKAACRADLLTRVGFDPADVRPVIGMIGRLDPQKGFDLLSDAAPDAARSVESGWSSRAAAIRRWPAHSARSRPRIRIGSSLIERFDRAMARRIYAGAGPVRHAVAIRAVRAGPDDRPALRHAADRPSDRRPGRHRDRRDDEPGPRHRLLVRWCHGPWVDRCLRGRRQAASAGGPAWTGLVDRGMAVDFDWTTGSAPRYLEAYRRAVAIRRETAPVTS